MAIVAKRRYAESIMVAYHVRGLPVNATSPVSTTKASASSFSFSRSSFLCACMLRHGTTKPMLFPPASSVLPSDTSFDVSLTWPFSCLLPFCVRMSSGWYCSVSRRSFWSRWLLRKLRHTPRTAFVEKRCWYGDMVDSRARRRSHCCAGGME
jgi:hypothetical protein